jgi:2-succinyl-5-enolpyruvyl-6-hydroxy-3-cyclohexene-1-carboxylate synthase
MTGAPSNLAVEWGAVLFDGLAKAGATDVVISPGSRSTPFVLAAQANPGLRCHSVIDERSAAFFALGLAKVTGNAPVLLCTSGTAGAHYLPAVIEASQSFTPLLVVTADRPFELQQCGASQTIDQQNLFGAHARLFVDLGTPDPAPEALRWLHRSAARALLATRWPTPGAVHLNARARKPLEAPASLEATAKELAGLAQQVSQCARVETLPPRATPSPEALEGLARACRKARRGLIVSGPAPLGQGEARAEVAALARRTGFPLLCEATSQFRFCAMDALRCDAFDALYRSESFRSAFEPDLVIQVGPAPVSAGWERIRSAERWVVAPYGWNDPRSDASAMVFGDVAEVLRGTAERLEAAEPSAWARRWQAANRDAWRAIEDTFRGGELGEGFAVRAVVESVPQGSILALGNSLPIREVDTFSPAGATECRVWSQRGASGIDGLVSGAAGAACSGSATTLLLGDVSFLHDLGGLAIARKAQVPLVIVILNNDGGRIFDQMPVSQAASRLEAWTTPHGLQLSRAAELFELPTTRVASRAELAQALARAHARAGCSVIEAVVPPHSSAAAYREIGARIDTLAARGWEALP